MNFKCTPASLRILAGWSAANMVCLIQDGMDQAKFKVPRVREIYTKLYSKLFKPTRHVVGSWLHGHALNFAVADPDLRKDSSTQIEVMARTLSDAFDTYNCLSSGFQIQQDNTYREGKNKYATISVEAHAGFKRH